MRRKKTNIKVTECVNTNSLKKNQFLLFSFSWIFLSTISMLMLFSKYTYIRIGYDYHRPTVWVLCLQTVGKKENGEKIKTIIFIYICCNWKEKLQKGKLQQKRKNRRRKYSELKFYLVFSFIFKLFAFISHFMSMLRLSEFSQNTFSDINNNNSRK